MDPRLLEYFNKELTYLREMGQEFADEHPKIASRLGMNGVEVADPFVERLFEGFSFLSARIQSKMDAQFPHFSFGVLETLFPNYLAPTPSMTVVEMRPDMKQGSLAKGFLVPKNSSIFAGIAKGEKTACQFQTAHDVMLWPLEILEVVCTGAPPDLPLAGLNLEHPVKGAIRIRIRATKGNLAQLNLERLTFFLSGPDEIASQLYASIFAHSLGVIGCETHRPVKWMKFLQPETISTEGFNPDQAMLPYDKRTFQGYRLLHEYFSLPHRYQFFSLTGLGEVVSGAQGDTIDLTILLDCPIPELEKSVDRTQLALFCTPAINLFPKRGDSLKIDPQRKENWIPADKSFPFDYEIHSISSAKGHEERQSRYQEFYAFHLALGNDSGSEATYYTLRREPRMRLEDAQDNGRRGSYVGNEVSIALVDENQKPLEHALQTLSIEMLCTNRDLPFCIPQGGQTDFKMEASAPIASIKMLRGPTEPKAALADGERAWRLINHLNLNFMALLDVNPVDGAQALRELLLLYSPLADLTVKKRAEAIRHVIVSAITRRLPSKGQIVMGRGLRVALTVDEDLFDGVNPYLFGAVLEKFFSRFVGQNSFIETSLHSQQRGEIARWKPRMGTRPIA